MNILSNYKIEHYADYGLIRTGELLSKHYYVGIALVRLKIIEP